MKRPLVFSLGGSVIVPKGIDIDFLRSFARFVRQIAKTRTVAIICGGGSTARSYVAAARSAGAHKTSDLHWIGIRSCQLNSELVRTVLQHSSPVVLDKGRLRGLRQNPIIVAPSKPGSTSDYGGVLLARELGATTVVNISNVDGVFTADPRRVRSATCIPRITWDDYLRMIPKTVHPGMHAPFDPAASRLASRLGMDVIVVSKRIENLRKVVHDRPFRGTRITPS